MMGVTLAVDDRGCVVAGGAEGGDAATLVWPAGYSVRGDAESFDVVDAGGSVVASSGQDLEIGGGGADSADDAWGNIDCVSGTIWMVGGVEGP